MTTSPAIAFSDLAESAEFREFYAMLWSLAGVVVALVDPSGKHGKAYFTPGMMGPVCREIQATEAGRFACLRDSQRHCEQVKRDGNPLHYRCHAGLVDFVIPVVVKGHHIASIEGGQIPVRRPTPAGFRRLWRRVAGYGANRAALRRAYFGSPAMTPERLEAVLGLVRLFARHFCEAAWRIRSEPEPHPEVLRAQQYIREHFEEDLYLGEVAAHVHLTPAYFSGLFRARSGMAFTAFLQSIRVEKAAQLLRETDRRITDIAFATGFNNLTNFSYVFRRFERCSPSRYRKRNRASRQ